MSARLLTGKEPAQKILDDLRPKVRELNPKLSIVQVGDDPASNSYIRKKMESCDAIAMRSELIKLAASTTFEKLLGVIEQLNTDKDVSGFIVQLHLPGKMRNREPELFKAMDPRKDVDGFTAYNVGKMFRSKEFEHLPPATPAGIMSLLEYYKIGVEGRIAVVIGQSNIVGKPLSIMLKNRGATTINCDIHTPPEALRKFCKNFGELLFTAVGKPGLITGDMIKPGATVIDIGVNRVNGKLVGDVDFATAKEVAGAITPVPGGVGPLTVASLLRNVVRAAERQQRE